MLFQTPAISRQSIFVILPFFLWGTAMVVMKSVLPHTSPFFLAAVRLIPAGILLLIAASWLGRSGLQSWRSWLWVALFGLVDGTLFQGFLALGLVRTGAGLGSLLIDSQPLAVAVLAALFYQERISLVAIGGLLLGIVGIGTIGLPAHLMNALLAGDLAAVWHGGIFTLGEWFMLGASLSMAVGTILIRPVVRNADPVVATGWHMILGGLPLLAVSALTETQQWQDLNAWGWLGMSYMTVMGSAIAYGLFFYFASSGSLTTLSALTFSTPVFALLFGSIFLGESLTHAQWVGVVLTLTSIYLVSVRNPDRRKVEDSPSVQAIAGSEVSYDLSQLEAIAPVGQEVIVRE
jgi:drug/metabolite transporter (DMT)-like permease